MGREVLTCPLFELPRYVSRWRRCGYYWPCLQRLHYLQRQELVQGPARTDTHQVPKERFHVHQTVKAIQDTIQIQEVDEGELQEADQGELWEADNHADDRSYRLKPPCFWLSFCIE